MVEKNEQTKPKSSVERSNQLRNYGTYFVLGLALLAMALFGVCDPRPQRMLPGGQAAAVADQQVSEAEFRRAYRVTYQRMQEQYRDQFDPAVQMVSSQVIEELVKQRILYLIARDSGLKASEDEVYEILRDAQAFKDEESGKFSTQNFDNYLRFTGHTEKSFMDELRRDKTVSKLYQFLRDTAFVSE